MSLVSCQYLLTFLYIFVSRVWFSIYFVTDFSFCVLSPALPRFFCIVIFSQRITAKSLFLSLVLFPRWVHALPATRWFYNSRQSVSPVSSSLSSSPLQPNCFSFTSSSALQFCTCAPFTQVTTSQGFTAACAYIPTRVSC